MDNNEVPFPWLRLTRQIPSTGMVALGYVYKVLEKVSLASNLMYIYMSAEATASFGCDYILRQGIMPTKTELVLEQTQQGVSDEVLVSIEGVEELKRNERIKGVKKEALHTLRQKPGQKYAIRNTKLLSGIEDRHHGPSDAKHNPP
ncbi:reverse transcriptase domain-containing protein [Tanacetum coccineum]